MGSYELTRLNSYEFIGVSVRAYLDPVMARADNACLQIAFFTWFTLKCRYLASAHLSTLSSNINRCGVMCAATVTVAGSGLGSE